MITNGSIQKQVSSGTGLDENGDPVVSNPVWSEPIPCLIKTIKHDNKGIYPDGKFTQASFEILIEMQEFEAERILLKNSRNNFEAEFEIQDIQFLDLVGRVKIIV
jgi:hypothetical protein